MLIFEHPGNICVGKYQMKLGGEPDLRNKTLMKMFILIDIGERAGSGVPELCTVWEKEDSLYPDGGDAGGDGGERGAGQNDGVSFNVVFRWSGYNKL